MSNGYEFSKRGAYVECIENPPEIPNLFLKVWDWFLDLNASRDKDNCLSLSDINFYFNMRQERPSNWELELLQQMDACCLAAFENKDVQVMDTAE